VPLIEKPATVSGCCILARMKIALLKPNDKTTITADEAVAKDERRAFCPKCKHPVRLHRCKKIASHFEHLERIGLDCEYGKKAK
jgi:competence CoiA-like predicted nuclease